MKHAQTHKLIDLLIKKPEEFSSTHINTLLGIDPDHLPENPYLSNELVGVLDLKSAILRIFDQNDDFKFDNANSGYLGRLNDRSQRRRNRRFIRKLKANPKALRIVAEGDSWFEHPISNDVIDWIDELGGRDAAVYSLARGGDFLTNILEEREYITDVSIINPDAFLVSAGGIELVNQRRVALMVNAEGAYVDESFKRQHSLLNQVLHDETLPIESRAKIERGVHFLNREYFSLIAVLELKYKYMIKQLRKKFPDLKMICHGYDYPIPSFRRGSWFHPIDRLMRQIGDNGHHFKQPMLIKKIYKQEDQNDITFAMLHLFNEMLKQVVNDKVFGKGVYMIDCRGYALPEDWFDELHLEPKKIKRVAEVFWESIRNTDSSRKIFCVRR